LELRSLKICLVHDWLVTYRGGEKVLAALSEMFPQAPIFTLFYDKKMMPPILSSKRIIVPPMSYPIRPFRKLLLPLLPRMVESIDLADFDLIISSSSCVAKGVLKPKTAKHLCYIHSPMRYVWDQMEEYIQGVKHIPGAEVLIRSWAPKLRRWDVDSSDRVDHYVANSHFVKKRVQDYYNKSASVIPPPIAVEEFYENGKNIEKKGYFLAAGALVSYKRFDLALEACKRLKKRLIIAGSGPMLEHLRKNADDSIEFVVQPDDAMFKNLLAGADALIFPGIEDFGMVAIEAMASGTPVIAFKGGGALDFIEEGLTGVFFGDPTPESLISCLEKFSRQQFSREKLYKYSEKYNYTHFVENMQREIDSLL
jgi:glycosyltransferase involved in cell wall biosynthesis